MAEEKQVEHCVSCNVRLTGEGAVSSSVRCVVLIWAGAAGAGSSPTSMYAPSADSGAVIPWEM